MAKKGALARHVEGKLVAYHPEQASTFASQIEQIEQHKHADEMIGSAAQLMSDEDFWDHDGDSWISRVRPYEVIDGVLQIPVMGVLLHRFPYQLGGWATGYKYIEMAVKRGLADGNVRGIAFVCDSGGGLVAGCFELTDMIYEARGQKPMRAYIADVSCSACYCLASAADELVITRSGVAGSIGVLITHIEISEMMKQYGYNVTFIQAGEKKTDGHPFKELSESAQQRYQDRVDKSYGVFVSTVERNRGMDAKAIRATEADVYDADEAIEIGLVDRQGELDEELIIFAEEVETGEPTMATNPNNKQTKAEADEDVVARADHDKAVSDAEARGSANERARISGIMQSPEGKARPKAARSLAMNSSMTVEEATAALGEMDEEKAEAPKQEQKADTPEPEKKAEEKGTGEQHFSEAMSGNNPEVGAGDDSEKGEDGGGNPILADMKRARGAS